MNLAMNVLRSLIKEFFIEHESSRYKYVNLSLLTPIEAIDITDSPIPLKTIGYILLTYKYCSVEYGWRTANEFAFIHSTGEFTPDGYCRRLSKLIPIWIHTCHLISSH